METFYLIDYENVHDEGLENILFLPKTDHVHIFSTENAPKIRMDFVFSKEIDIEGHIVPVRKQSLDMHLVSYLGYLLAIHGKQCTYIIISKDTDYDNIIKFWKEKGYLNISRQQKIPDISSHQKKTISSAATTTSQTTNSQIRKKSTCIFSGNDRCKLNEFMQHELITKGYSNKDANRICKYIIAHCNDERMLSGIHNELKNNYSNYQEIYQDVKEILEQFLSSKNKPSKREVQIRSFWGQHFRKKIYLDKKEEIIKIIITAKTKQQINNHLMKLYADGTIVKHIYQTIQPLIKDLPGR